MSGKTYLGDGVYVVGGPFRGAIKLTAENGIEATDTIVLEPEVLAALAEYLDRATLKRPKADQTGEGAK